MNKLVIIGAGGHGRVIADIAAKNGYTDISFVDDNALGECMGIPIVGKSSDIERLNDGITDFVIGIGNNAIRKAVAEKHKVNWVTLIHPSARIAASVSLGEGCVVMAGAIVNPCAAIGKHAIVNSGAIVEHDCHLGDFVHVSPGATVCGSVELGESTWICAGACVINNVSICADSVVGAGAVVTETIKEKGTYVGVPARKVK